MTEKILPLGHNPYLYRGQLLGGPDHGNFIDSSVPHVKFEAVQRLWVDGQSDPQFAEFTVSGWYVWDAATGTYGWELSK